MSVAVRKSEKIARLSQGEAKVLIKEGIIDQKVMQDLRFTVIDILEAMRCKDIFYLEEIKLAIVETTGSVSIYPDPKAQTNIDKADIPPIDVISDGKIRLDHLSIVAVTEEKIRNILIKENTELPQVLLLLVDGNGQYNLTVMED